MFVARTRLKLRIEEAHQANILDQANYVRQVRAADMLEAQMRNLRPRLLFIAACIFAGSGAAYAGAKHVHNMDVKAQCITKADEAHLTGHQRHDQIKQCKEEGMSYAHRF